MYEMLWALGGVAVTSLLIWTHNQGKLATRAYIYISMSDLDMERGTNLGPPELNDLVDDFWNDRNMRNTYISKFTVFKKHEGATNAQIVNVAKRMGFRG